MLRRAKIHPRAVLSPLNPNANGARTTPPGRARASTSSPGRARRRQLHLRPTYLLNWGVTTTDKVDLPRVRAQSIAFTEMILRLARTPRAQLRSISL